MLSGMGYPTGKKTRAGTGMGKNSNPHVGMDFLAGGSYSWQVRVWNGTTRRVSTRCHL
jgi:hypothetical protein